MIKVKEVDKVNTVGLVVAKYTMEDGARIRFLKVDGKWQLYLSGRGILYKEAYIVDMLPDIMDMDQVVLVEWLYNEILKDTLDRMVEEDKLAFVHKKAWYERDGKYQLVDDEGKI